MCGIIGCDFTHADFTHAIRILKSRGPDNSGVWYGDNATLGHTRLAIIGLSDKSNQPMEKDDLVLVFNGEIYNYKELAKAENINISSDSEILLHLYQKYGQNFLNSLNGMFAFVIYDKKKNEYFGARDTFGKKPLYYHKGKNFIFSSRISAILTLLDTQLKPNFSALNTYLSFMSCIGEETFYENIYKIPAGCYFTYKNKSLKISRFSRLDNVKSHQIDFDCAKTATLDLIKKSLDSRLTSDVPISFLLSGGMDSSFICALYKQENDIKPNTFSLGFGEYKAYDETNYARLASNFIGTNHHEIFLHKQDFFDILDEFYDFIDEPLADSAVIPTKFLSKNIHENGFKVAISGEGSDECFLGYDLYFRVLEFYQKSFQKSEFKPISKDYEYLRRKELGLPIYGTAGEVFTSWQKQHLLSANFFAQLNSPELLEQYGRKYKNLKEMSYIDFEIWIKEVLTTKIDRASMAHSLEIRSPFLDVDLVRFCLSLNDEVRYLGDGGKPILKSIAKNLIPLEIINRKKKGFSSPYIEWLLSEFKEKIINEILSVNTYTQIFNPEFVEILYQKAQSGRFKQHLWTLFIFAKWFKRTYL